MRNIKFRGKRIDNDEWAYGSLVIREQDFHGTPGYFISAFGGEWMPVYPDTVGQYIDYKCCDGTDIYEGDIIESNGRERSIDYGFISADGEAIGYAIYDLDEDTKVIGNIYEDPELSESSL